MFAVETKKVFKVQNRGTIGKGVILDAKENKNFSWKIWSIEKEHNREAECLQELEEMKKVNMKNLDIIMEMVKNRAEGYIIGRLQGMMKVSRVIG